MKFQFHTSYDWEQDSIGQSRCAHGSDISVAAPPVFKGPKGHWSPEDLLLSAAESCLFLSFNFEVKRSDLELVSYQSKAEGVVEKVDGGLRFTSITISPVVKVVGSAEKAQELLEKAHSSCLVARSLDTKVELNATVEGANMANSTTPTP